MPQTHPCFRDAAASLTEAGYAYDRELACWTRPDGARARIERVTRAGATPRTRAYAVHELEGAKAPRALEPRHSSATRA